MENKEKMVKMLYIDENGNTIIDEITKTEAEEAMLYAQPLNEMPEEEQLEVKNILDKLLSKDLK